MNNTVSNGEQLAGARGETGPAPSGQQKGLPEYVFRQP
jgi:hypothetical protein